MKSTEYNINWLSDPTVYEVNRELPVSSHLYTIPGKESTQSLNGTWQFAYTDRLEERIEDFYKEDFDASGFGTIEVPGNIETQGYGQIRYNNKIYPWDGVEDLKYGQIPEKTNGTSQYIKVFDLDPNLEDERIHLVFNGVQTAFYVWLNGKFVGYAEDSFTPSRFDVTNLIEKTGNVLAVQVHQYSSASWLEDQDMFRFTGIFRDVELKGMPRYHIEDLKINTELYNNYKQARILMELTCLQPDPSYTVTLKDASGTRLMEFDTTQSYLACELDDVHLWSAEDPYLYILEIQVKDPEGKVCETVIQKVGLREFTMEDGVMMLNGKRIVFKGINRHEFSKDHGHTVSKEDMIADIRFLKQNNVNAVRTSHYPNHELWYDLADEYGLYLMDEANLETHGTWNPLDVFDYTDPLPGNHREWRNAVLDRANSMYQRDKNHPSILIWSLGNEAAAGDIMLEEAGFFRQVDPSRLVHYESSWNQPEYADCTDMYSRMYPTAKEVEEYLKSDPEKPIVLCEYAHSMGNSTGDLMKYTELEKYDQYQGGFIWDFMDQAITVCDDKGRWLGYGGDFGELPHDGNFSGNGILFADRTPTPKAQEMKHLYANLKIEPNKFGVKIKNDNLFTNASAYEFRYKLEKEGQILQEGTVDVDIEPGAVKKVYIPWKKTDGEVIKTVSAHLKEDTPWASKGHEIAFGQMVSGVWSHLQAEPSAMEIVEGKGNVGFYGDDFSCFFSQAGLISLKYSGVEMLDGPVKPIFAHAITDNEKGFGFDHDSAMWFAASQFARITDIQRNIDYENHIGIMQYTYALPTSPKTECIVSYSVAAPGLLGIDVMLKGRPGLPKLPQLSLQFKLKKELDNFIYYGKGPEENYIDRAEGARLGVFEKRVINNLTPYLVPQESGGRTDVRWLEVEDGAGSGISFSMVSNPLQINVQPYSFEQIQNALHQYELPRSQATWVTISKEQMGVGGDDSWGLPVLDEYMLKGSENHTFSFIVSRALKAEKKKDE